MNWCPRCGQAGMEGITHACPPPIGPSAFQVTARAPVLCPVCVGKQRVRADFYPVGVGESSVAGEYVTCRSCGGRGTL